MSNLLIFGPGYSAGRIATALTARDWRIETIGRERIADRDYVANHISRATHILSSIPPDAADDPVLDRYADLLAEAPARWIGYLSSTGVYGDSGGAWVDETAPVAGRRPGRNQADGRWLALHSQARLFRLPGIYGPGRSALDRIADGQAHRVDVPHQVFSRIHVDDLVAGVLASIDRGPPGAYNLADDHPAPQQAVIAYAARLLGRPVPPLIPLAEANLSPQARAFYAENRRVANGKARRLLGWRPLHTDYRAGLRACAASASKADASAAISPSA